MTLETLKAIEAERTQFIASRDKAESRASAWKPKTDSLMGKEENLSSPLQIAKTAIYLAFKKQAAGEPPPHLMFHLLTKFPDYGKKITSCEEALQNLEHGEKGLKRLMAETDVLVHQWLEMDTALQDIDNRVEELPEDNMLQMRIQGLYRDWKEVAGGYETKKWSYVLIIMIDSSTYPYSANYTPEQQLKYFRAVVS
jgi:hypothetical protein